MEQIFWLNSENLRIWPITAARIGNDLKILQVEFNEFIESHYSYNWFSSLTISISFSFENVNFANLTVLRIATI